jgi:drug/metabolite transporter (DMT)-like permease
MPPILAAGARFTVAGLIMAAALSVRAGPGRLRVTRAELAGAAFVGITLLSIGNAFVSLGEQTVPSGLAALIVGVLPLVVLVFRRVAGERISRAGLAGVLLGFVGLGVLVVPRGIDGSADVVGMVLLIVASISWAGGSFMSRRLSMPRDGLVSTAWQLLTGGGVLVAAGLLLGESSQVESGGFTEASVWALVYLVVFGSLLAYTAYSWLLRHAPISKVATYAYVNPVVAVALGTLFLDEVVDPLMLVGAVIIVGSVAFTIRTESRPAVREMAVDCGHVQAEPRRRDLLARLRGRTAAR